MTLTLVGIGLFGFLGLSVLCPLMALPAYYFRFWNVRKNPFKPEAGSAHPQAIEIIIPAHNEAEFIGTTLTSIQHAVRHLQAATPASLLPTILIKVGADGCSDATASMARQFSGVSVSESQETRSKWATIKALLADSSADWSILADVGTVWPETLLTGFLQRLEKEPNALALAPSYRPLKAGWVSRILWQVERSLKKMEALCGGPISLHGATIAYKTFSLKNVLGHLDGRHWLNDDVVVPLLLRSLYPDGVILYPVGQVQDAGVRPHQLDIGRRKRMLEGNLQWTRTLLPNCFRLNPIAGIVAGRRLFRIFWAYWFCFMALGLALTFHGVVLPVIAVAGILTLTSGSFRQLAGAALVSLLAPIPLIFPQRSLEISWK